MQIRAEWSRPLPLRKSSSHNQIYEVDLDKLPNSPGVYVFCRQYADKVVPIYIGQTISLCRRIKGHLNSLPLMREIEHSPNGQKLLIYCTVPGNEERAQKQIKIIEKALIQHAQTAGHVLFNKQGTKLPTDEISFTGNVISQAIAPRVMRIKKLR